MTGFDEGYRRWRASTAHAALAAEARRWRSWIDSVRRITVVART